MFVMFSGLFVAALWSPAGKGAYLLALLCVMFSCMFVTFPCGVLGQVSYLIVSLPDFCLLTYFEQSAIKLCVYTNYFSSYFDSF